jgi:hypothetical protein
MENEASKKILIEFFGFDLESELQNIKSSEDKLKVLREKYFKILNEIPNNKKDLKFKIGKYYLGKIFENIHLEVTSLYNNSKNYNNWLESNLNLEYDDRNQQYYRNLYKYIRDYFNGAIIFKEKPKLPVTIFYDLPDKGDDVKSLHEEVVHRVKNDPNLKLKDMKDLLKKWRKEQERINQLHAEIDAEMKHLDNDRYYEPTNREEAEKRISVSILQRRGQPKFREDLLKAYDSKCAITGCDAQEALEAAHIIPYRETENNHLSNGLLLRADLHTLFDLNLIAIDPYEDSNKRKVRIAPSLRNTEYKELEGRPLREPNNEAYLPKKEFLEERCKQCWWYRYP